MKIHNFVLAFIPHVQVRNFLESALSDLRELWMKRISYRACVPCTCDRECTPHTTTHCKMEECMHFLNLDECLSNKVRSTYLVVIYSQFSLIRTLSFLEIVRIGESTGLLNQFE